MKSQHWGSLHLRPLWAAWYNHVLENSSKPYICVYVTCRGYRKENSMTVAFFCCQNILQLVLRNGLTLSKKCKQMSLGWVQCASPSCMRPCVQCLAPDKPAAQHLGSGGKRTKSGSTDESCWLWRPMTASIIRGSVARYRLTGLKCTNLYCLLTDIFFSLLF